MPKTLFGRLFLLIFGFMIFLIILVRLIFGFFVANQAAQQFANYSQALMSFAGEFNKLDSNRQFIEQLQQNTGIILLRDAAVKFDAMPNIPIYKTWEASVNQNSLHEITMSYQKEPQQMIWLHHQKLPQYSLGLPALVQADTMKRFIGITMLVGLVFAACSAYVAAYFLNRPLRELADQARLIGQEIDSIEIEPSGPEEIRAVALAMSKMRADLDGLSKKQKFLLSGISHDLRTPLTRIHIATQLLPPDTQGFIEGINADIDEMNGVIHRFIELARFNIEETELWQVGDIATLISEVAAKYQHSGTGIILSLADTPPVRYKLKGLQSYLFNLINNSIKHGAGNITISTQTVGDRIELCVSDQGSGFSMSPEQLSAYSDLSVNHDTVNGLGLRIVQLIARMHEAQLTLRNKLEGGAEVTLTLKVYNSLPPHSPNTPNRKILQVS